MMVSNGLSARRGPLRRPKVCLTHPNPGRCEPPPPPSEIVCSIGFDEPETVYVGEEYTLVWYGCNPDYDDTVMLSPVIGAALGELFELEDGENCVAGHNVDYVAPDDPGDEVITMDIAWPDTSTCQSVLSFPVVEENGD